MNPLAFSHWILGGGPGVPADDTARSLFSTQDGSE
jgi:hypothetical protein